MDSLNLKSLIEVARTGSFSKAAENLFVTQSAVSRRIKCIEEEFGCTLLDRSGVTTKPTAAGKVVISEAERILGIEENLLRRLEALEQNSAISFACTQPFGIVHLPGVLKGYTKKYSNLNNLKIAFEHPCKALEGLKEGAFDFIVIEHWDLLDQPGHLTLPLPEDEMVFVSSPKLGLPEGVVGIDELVRQRMYRRRKDCCFWKHLASSMQLAGRDVSEFSDTVTYDDLHVIMQSVIDGDGIALICRDLVKSQISEGLLREHQITGFNHRRKRTLIMAPHAARQPAINFFVSCIFSSFGADAPDLEQCEAG